MADFAVARGFDQMPAFAWWVGHTLKKRDVIIASVKQRIAKTSHKYGIEVPQLGITLKQLTSRMEIICGVML